MNTDRIKRIYDQLSSLKYELDDLNDETPCDALEDAVSDIDAALDDLGVLVDTPEIEIHVRRRDGGAGTFDVSDNLGKLLKLLGKTDSTDDEAGETDSDEASDNVFCAILESIRIMSEHMTKEQLDSAIARIQEKLSGE